MATSTTTRPRSTTAKRAPRKSGTTAKRTATTAARAPRAQTITDEAKAVARDAKTAVRSARTRATRAVKKVPTDRTTLSIAAGVIAGIVAAGVAIFFNRDKLRDAATTGGEKLKKAADDLSTLAHERIDQARDNITKLRARNNNGATPATPASEHVAING